MRKFLFSSRCDATDRAGAGTRQSAGRRRNGAPRRTLAVLVGCIALFAVAPVAAQAATATLEGTVTAVKGSSALEGIQVTATSEGGGSTSEVTKAGGVYKITGLLEGDYTVRFHDPAAKYVDQSKSIFLPESTTETLDAAMQEPGTISGKVTSAATGSGLGNVNVSAEKLGGTGFSNHSATTESDGDYTITGLPPGEYSISFSPNEGGYIFQSTTTTVGEDQVSTVSPALKEGGKISGRVTDSVSHGGLAKIVVNAFSSNPEEGGFGEAKTNANGEYTVTGLSNGSYKVRFEWEYSEAEAKEFEKAKAPRFIPKYITQYFNNQPSAVAANTVGASEGNTTSGINVTMVPAAPVNTALPAVSGTPTVGSLLSCSNGSWTGESEQTLSVGWPLASPFAYQWLRDGGAIAGATSPAYLVQAADVGHGLACEVGATNYAGHASAKSNPLAVTLPAVTVSSAKLVVSGGSARVPVACANAACAGTIELTGQIAVKGKGKKKAKKQTVVLGKGSYSLAAGKSATIVVRLTAAGKNALAKAKGHKLSGNAGATVAGGLTVTKPVVLSEAAKKKPPKNKGKKK
jgi:Carboxypeptidase regulatory-like domain